MVQDLIDELGRLPGVGPKSAQRIAFHILQAEPADVRRLAQALLEVKAKVRFCATCGNVAQEELCGICRDSRRDASVICVVEEPKDVVAIERTREFRGRYHVLGGAISPIEASARTICGSGSCWPASRTARSRSSSWPPIPISRARRRRRTSHA